MFPSLAELQLQREHKAATLKDILKTAEEDPAGSRPLTTEETSLFDKVAAELGVLDSKIADVQSHLERQEKVSNLTKKYEQGPGRKTTPETPDNATAAGTPSNRIPAEVKTRVGRLRAFKGHDADEKAYRSGMWARATLFRDHRAVQWCAGRGLFDASVHNALSGGTNANGGYLVPEEFSQAVIDLREQYGVFRRNCFVQPMGRDTMVVPRRATGITIAAVGENPSSAISQSTPTWSQVRLTAKKAGGLVLMSSEIAEDAVINLADYLASEFAYAFALFEDQCGFIGDATSTYMGINGLGNILTVASGLAGAVACATATHDTFAEIDATDLATAMAALPEYAKVNAKWYCSSVCDELVFGRLLAAAGGNSIATLENGRPMRSYMGYPIEISQVLPNGPTTDYSGLPMLYFGDLGKAATLGDRRDVRVFPSEHRYMDVDQIGVRGTTRFDVVVHDYGTTSAAGPIVALCGGAS